MQDKVVGWDEEEVAPQQDTAPSAPDPEPERATHWQRRRGRIATAVLVAGVLAGAVAVVMLCHTGWQKAETDRGFGAGRGVVTFAACNNPQKDGDGDTTYTCTGTFARQGVAAAPRGYSFTDSPYHKAGATVPARLAGNGEVFVSDSDQGDADMTFWLAAALVVVIAGGAVVRLLVRWIRGVPVGLEWDEALMSGFVALFLALMFYIMLWGIVAACYAIL